MVLYNAFCYDDAYKIKRKCVLIIEQGIIKRIIYDRNIDNITFPVDCTFIDCKGRLIVPGFVDTHLHFPGSFLYKNYGISFLTDAFFEDYITSIRNARYKGHKAIRGYGWDKYMLDSIPDCKGYKIIKKELDHLFGDRPAILYSNDYHSFICNQYLINLYRQYGENVPETIDETGLFEEGIIDISNIIAQLSFNSDEIKGAIEQYQEMLLQNGITCVQSLMFLGGDGNTEWGILKKMDEEHQLKIKVNLALNVYPHDTFDEICKRFDELQKYSFQNISVNTVKMYIDGVVENKTAYLFQPYNNTDFCGTGLWNVRDLKKVCAFLDKKNIQIHAHAVGDAAVHDITEALCFAMDTNKTKGKRCHVITHLQFAENKDIIKMGEYEIIACIQPYWIPEGENYYPIDIKHIGDRVYNEYKLGTFIKNGVCVTASSDSPITQEPNPFIAIDLAVNRHNISERAGVIDMLKAFTVNGAFQLMRENEIGIIREGYKADLLVISDDPLKCKTEHIKNIKILMTVTDGKIRFSRLDEILA